jgi:uncharacterized membrane protein YeaQ/YmgE (transglycosylase-associated protein family)
VCFRRPRYKPTSYVAAPKPEGPRGSTVGACQPRCNALFTETDQPRGSLLRSTVQTPDGRLYDVSRKSRRKSVGIIAWIVVGAIAGYITNLLMGGKEGVIETIILGIIGAVVGGWLFGMLGVSLGGGLIGSVLVAFVGACILLWLVRLIKTA